jgi:hypothetical protein
MFIAPCRRSFRHDRAIPISFTEFATPSHRLHVDPFDGGPVPASAALRAHSISDGPASGTPDGPTPFYCEAISVGISTAKLVGRWTRSPFSSLHVGSPVTDRASSQRGRRGTAPDLSMSLSGPFRGHYHSVVVFKSVPMSRIVPESLMLSLCTFATQTYRCPDRLARDAPLPQFRTCVIAASESKVVPSRPPNRVRRRPPGAPGSSRRQ